MGVLYQHGDDVGQVLIPYLRRRGCTADTADIEDLYIACSLGRISSHDFWIQAGVGTVASDEEYCAYLTLTDEIEDLLADLSKRNVALACLSNDVAEWSLLTRKNTGLDRYIPNWVISADVGVRKPNHAIFEALLDTLGLLPDEIVLIDDRPKNVAAADRFGIYSILYGESSPSFGNRPSAETIDDLRGQLINKLDPRRDM